MTGVIPTSAIPPLGADGRFTLGWYRYFQGLGGTNTGGGTPGPPGPTGPRGAQGPAGPSGSGSEDALAVLSLSFLDEAPLLLTAGEGITLTPNPITGPGTIALTVPVKVADGGTGQTSYTNGQLLIGNTTGNTLAKSTLTAGTGINITNGAGSITVNNTGVTSVALSAPAEFVVSGSPVTTTGTLTLTKATETANTVWAGPTTGAAAQPTFRALVGADLPNPSSTTLGGIESFAAVSHEWINQISTSGVPTATQPAATDLSDFVGQTNFTPTITFATPGDLSVSYTQQTGVYTKVGTIIIFVYNLAFTPTYTTASGALQISLPPVSITSALWAWPIRTFSAIAWPAGVTQIFARPLATNIAISGIGASTAVANFTTTQFTSGSAYGIAFGGFYY